MSSMFSHQHHHHHSSIEKVGMYLSVLCAIHCMAMPVVITALPMMGSSFLNNPLSELTLIGLSMLLATWILWKDYRKHQQKLPLLMIGLGLFVKALAIFFFPTYDILTASFIALLMVGAYFINWKNRVHCES